MDRYSLVSRSIGSFTMDVVTVEMHESELTLTENPIESGANIADHAILQPRQLTIIGTMVGYEPKKTTEEALAGYGFNVSDLPLPVELSAVTSQGLSIANRYASSIATVETATKRVIAEWLPDYVTYSNDESDTLDRVGKARNQLLQLQRSGETIDIVTGLAKYSNMMITSVGVFQQYDGSAEFTISCREVFIVESKKGSGLKVKTTRAGQQSAGKKNSGKTNPKEDRSMLDRVRTLF